MADQYWITVQKKSFARWCSELLKKRNLAVHELETDFKDGTLLVQLIEILTSKSIKHTRNPRMDVQKYENLTLALEFLKTECKIHLVNIGPNDIHDGNLKLILGLLWAMILHFKIKAGSGSDDGSANKDLLDWVNKQIPTYNIKNFTTDWANGKAICALAEALHHGQMHLPKDFSNDPVTDASLGIKKAHENMAIPVIIDPEDVVHHPDQHAMMTYIAYFREYEKNQSNLSKQKDLETTPDITKCIVYGPGLEPGNDQGKETYFTIEVRNSANRKVPQGGHNISVKITGPHSKNAFNAHDNSDGTYYVTFAPIEDGNYVIEVQLEKQPIQGSPFHVTINEVQGPFITEPHPRWFVQDLTTKKWIPYEEDTSDELEKQFSGYGGGSVNILGGTFKVDLSQKEEINLGKKSLFSHEKRPVCRGTWFWKGDENEWIPYSEEIAVILEKAFKEDRFDKVDITEKKKIRYVQQLSPGVFTQHRQAANSNPEGRPVQRGYNGRTIQLKQGSRVKL